MIPRMTAEASSAGIVPRCCRCRQCLPNPARGVADQPAACQSAQPERKQRLAIPAVVGVCHYRGTASVDTARAFRGSCGRRSSQPDKPMTQSDLAATVDAAWEGRDQVSPATKGAWREAVEAALDGLDEGSLRVAEKTEGGWQVHQWLKKAV